MSKPVGFWGKHCGQIQQMLKMNWMKCEGLLLQSQLILLLFSRCHGVVEALSSQGCMPSVGYWWVAEHLSSIPPPVTWGVKSRDSMSEILAWLGGLVACLRACPLWCALVNNLTHPCKSVGDFFSSQRWIGLTFEWWVPVWCFEWQSARLVLPGAQVTLNSFTLSFNHQHSQSHPLLLFCLTAPCANPFAVMLSVLIPVGGWGCLSVLRQSFMGMSSCAFMWMATTSASAALPMTPLMVFERTWTDALNWVLSEDPRKMWPAALLLASGMTSKAASDSASRIMSLARHLISGVGLHAVHFKTCWVASQVCCGMLFDTW